MMNYLETVKISDNFGQFIDPQDIIITDSNLFECYKDVLSKNRVITIQAGEESKTISCVENVCRQLVDLQADRKSVLVGVGGGLVCDLTGFVGSVYMRGVDFKFIATSLLAQLDASLGGKNGVNLDGYKNLIGVFNNPKLVICALDALKTLPNRELISGYAEAVKCGIIGDLELFKSFESGKFTTEEIVKRSLKIKAEIVEKDPKETLGWRKLLNLGHTFGHAIEKSVPSKFLHGEAVGIGLIYAAKGSFKLGLCDKSTCDRIVKTVKNAGLPTDTDVTSRELAAAMLIDKKRDRDNIDFILIKNIGDVVSHPIKAEVAIIEQFLVSLRSL